MPIARVELKDGRIVPVDDIIQGKVRDSGFPISFIRAALKEHLWDGSPHVTALLNGTRETFLKYVSKYTLKLDQMAIAMAGTKFHANMENDVDLTELKISFDGIQGATDLLEVDPITGSLSICDYKLVGSFALKKWLGIVSKDVPVTDDFGNPVYLKSGKNAGQVKTKKEVRMDPAAADKFNYTMQTNIYRIIINAILADPKLLEKFPDLKGYEGQTVHAINIFFVLRDGSINHDFSNNSYLEPVEILPDEEVNAFIEDRAGRIRLAMSTYTRLKEEGASNQDAVIKSCPPMCSAHETWYGRKCADYCSVSEACNHIGRS